MIMSRLTEAGFDIHIFDADALVNALDDSADLPTGKGMEAFPDLMTIKYMQITPRLLDDLEMMGIEQPVLVEIQPCGSWYFADGHHRLSWALVHVAPVPVVFCTEESDPLELYDLLADNEDLYDFA